MTVTSTHGSLHGAEHKDAELSHAQSHEPSVPEASSPLARSSHGTQIGVVAAIGLVGLSSFFFGPRSQNSAAVNEKAPEVPVQVVPEKNPGDTYKTADPSAGWHWEVKPEALSVAVPDSKFVRLVFVDEARADTKWRLNEDELVITLPRQPDSSYELVAFNAQGERANIPVRTRDPRSFGFFITAIPNVHALGVQRGPADELHRIAEKTYALANESGVHVLPPRTLNQPYNFTLANVEGGLIKSQDFQGKVVVIFDWATWCMSCHAYMKDLLPLIEKYGSSVQFIAVDHDNASRADMARAEMKKFPAGTLHTSLFAAQAAASNPNDTLAKDIDGTWWMSQLGLSGVGIPRLTIVTADGKLKYADGAPSPITLKRIIDDEVKKAAPVATSNGG